MSEDRRLLAAEIYEEARVRRSQGNETGAVGRYLRCLELIQELGDTAWQAQIEAEVAAMYQDQYLLTDALEWYDTALRHFAALKDQKRVGQMQLGLGSVHLLNGNTTEAQSHLEQALRTLREAEDQRGAGEAQAELGKALWEAGDVAAGVAQIVAALGALGDCDVAFRARVLDQLQYRGQALERDEFRQFVHAATDDEKLRRQILE